MLVDDTTTVDTAMTPEVLTVGPGHTLRQIAQAMRSRKVGAAVVMDGDGQGIGIITERDILDAVASGEDLDTETAHDHTREVVSMPPDAQMTALVDCLSSRKFRRVPIVDGGKVVGIVSRRDILREMLFMYSRYY